MEKIYYVYTLQSTDGGIEYVGETTQPKIRFRQHIKWKPGNDGHGKFYGRTDLTMHTVEEFDNRKEALALEGRLKLENGLEWSERTCCIIGGKHTSPNGGKVTSSQERTCPHCNKTMKGSTYFRYHGDHCKLKG